MSTAAESAAIGTPEQHTFQAEIKQLLQILAHSLYQHREIALRELISNASDSLSKLRHLQLNHAELRDQAELQITLEPNADGKVLVIRDNGVGLTREEMVANLGTIARSGSREFIGQLQGAGKDGVSLIGQFGVGFYSAFMIADRVEVVSRGCHETTGWTWSSDGGGGYELAPAGDLPRGAEIRLHLKSDLVSEFTSADALKRVVRKYSAFVPFPIVLEGQRLNEQQPIWVEPKNQVTEEQYHGFYEWLTHHSGEKPLWHLHLNSDSPLQFQAVLFCPPMNLEKLGLGRMEHGLSLCAKRVLVQDDNKDLLPEYLHFLYGLVDSADLPLNVSRDTLQDSQLIPKLRRVLTKKVLDHLASFAEERPADYVKFYDEFGPILRSGVGSDFENRDRIAKLLRFSSSHQAADDPKISLEDYVKRAREDQTQIYLLSGPDRGALLQHPHVAAFKKRGLDVLLLTDPVDEFALQHLGEYAGKQLVSIDSAEVVFPPSTDAAGAESSAEQDKSSEVAPAGFERVLELFRTALGDRVQEVRKSSRLIDSPVCLVNPQGSMSSQLQKVLSQSMKDFAMARKIVEVNPTSALIQRLCQLTINADHDAFIQDVGQQLYANALLFEGVVTDPAEMAGRMDRFLQELANGKSAIITG